MAITYEATKPLSGGSDSYQTLSAAFVAARAASQSSGLNRTEEVMAFLNEFASEDDVRQYGLSELWHRYHPTDTPTTGFRHAWTVNHERRIFFMTMYRGREESFNEVTGVLSIRGRVYEVTVKIARGSSLKFEDKPFKRVWELIGIRPTTTDDVDQAELVDALKDALKAYGYGGVHRQVPNTVVEFRF